MKPDDSRGKVPDMRWLFPIALVLVAALLCYWLLGCGIAPPVKTPTPGGLVVWYEPNERRLSDEKAAELDARHAAVLECLPPEAFVRREPPSFAIEGRCDTFKDPWDGHREGGYTYLNGTRRIILPGSLGAAAHEMVHYYTGEVDGPTREEYRKKWLFRCGDAIDGTFRRLYPPQKCENDP